MPIKNKRSTLKQGSRRGKGKNGFRSDATSYLHKISDRLEGLWMRVIFGESLSISSRTRVVIVSGVTKEFGGIISIPMPKVDR
jgi:hypothetical protein